MPALVLGGGGAFGIVQAAYIQAAYEMGFRPGLVVGTSVGALNGAWVALHPDEPEALLEIWQTLHRHRILRGNPLKVALRAARRRRGIFRNDLVSNLLRTHIRSSRFSETKLPLRVVATNLTRGCKHVFNNGLIAPAILASTAIPGFFDPIEIGGELFVDGGIAASVDLATAVEMGASEILAVELAPIATLGGPAHRGGGGSALARHPEPVGHRRDGRVRPPTRAYERAPAEPFAAFSLADPVRQRRDRARPRGGAGGSQPRA